MVLEIINIVFLVIITLLVIYILFKNHSNKGISSKDLDSIKKTIKEINEANNKIISMNNTLLYEKTNIELNSLAKDLTNNSKLINDKLEQVSNYQKDFFTNFIKNNQNTIIDLKDRIAKEIKEFNNQVNLTLEKFSNNSNESINKLEKTLKDNLTEIRNDNNEKLEKINLTVNEKLEKTLEGKLKQSFDSVINQIGGVNKAIGEIKGLASDVGSLKNVLTNVKTKGICGEVILGNIIKEILVVGQYEENVVTKKNSTERVEFAIKMPGASEGEYVYLPIDSKLPLESYSKIQTGIDNGSSEEIKEGRKELRNAIKKYAKDINEKYIDVPNTTDFAIMFLPIEGLYIEALNMGLFEEVQQEYKVNIAGPTTLTAILNSLQMGFKTLAIQKKSSDVFKLLGAVKTEFEKFALTLEKTQRKVGEASDELDKLVGTRTRMIQSKLKNITNLDEKEASLMIEDKDN